MLIDKLGEFSDGQALTASAASTNFINFGVEQSVAPDVMPGRAQWVVGTLDVAADDGSANETYVVEVEVDDNSAFSSAKVIGRFEIPRGSPAGYQFVIGLNYGGEQYMRCNYTLGGTTPSVTLNTWLTDQEPRHIQAYPTRSKYGP